MKAVARGAALWVSMLIMSSSAAYYDDFWTERVHMWGTRFGTELWESLTRATRREEIQKGYDSHSDLKVDEIDGFEMVKKMAVEVEVMMQHKIDAIKNIMESAENVALDHKYDKYRGERLKAGQYTYINSKKLNILPKDDKGGGDEYERYLSQDRDGGDSSYAPGYDRMASTANKHFSGIQVNTSFSSVHVPTNLFDAEAKVINAIDWSRKLDDTFKDNYERDPGLSWQYFGSSTGFLRLYPAMKWGMHEDDADLYDARMRDWYIKSAASPKDIVILLDTSGSMTGLRKEIAKHVVLNLMASLGEDDFVTVLTFSDETRPLVECFTDENGEPELVQATTENIAEFTEALNNIETREVANFTSALTKSFELLTRYRWKKMGSESNQAIMLVTDGVPDTYETIFQIYNLPHKPARVFTYLTGREISDLEAPKWMACENKGYFTHVTTLEGVKEQVLKYISVLARPMVLLKKYHPIRWTGVYADIEELQGKEGSFKGYKLMTSVSIPVFNKKNHTTYDVLGLEPNETAYPFGQVRIAELLGVAGTDVPIADIKKLIPPYKLGVHGYSFAVNNNGHILYHPDLRPMFQEILKPNYNSIDLTEVELVDNEEPRYNDTALYLMRKEMVDKKNGMARLTVKVHMDDMKRATIREQDYFYHSISNTPFTLGIVMPSKHGKYRVSGGLELDQNSHIDVNTIFSDNRWKLHPDWVYCEYNYAGTDNRKLDSPEKNMKHFLERLADEKASFNWEQSRVCSSPECLEENDYWEYNEMESEWKNSHFCDKELVQALVLDGEITKIFTDEKSRKVLFKQSGIKLSFVATRSGLTRWEEYKEKDEFAYDENNDGFNPDNPREQHFSEVNNEASDEVWYKRAVEYHYKNPDSFVFSVPFDIGDNRPTTVTATHAIYKEMNGRKATAAVVGVQIDYNKFAQKFMDVTTGLIGVGYKTQSGEILSCQNESIECYVLDNNGFIAISKDPSNIGKFFGEVDGTILESLEQNRIFKKIKIYDYQAICLENATYINNTQPKPCDKESYLYELIETALPLQRPLQGLLKNCHESNCERPFSMTLIPNTNLVLIVADIMCPCYSTRISVNPTKVDYWPENETSYCEKIKTNLYRRKPMPCIHYHPEEEEMRLCGE